MFIMHTLDCWENKVPVPCIRPCVVDGCAVDRSELCHCMGRQCESLQQILAWIPPCSLDRVVGATMQSMYTAFIDIKKKGFIKVSRVTTIYKLLVVL